MVVVALIEFLNNHHSSKTLTMKKTLILLIAFIVIIIKTSAQSAGDYRSIANGNWNDPTKWETFDGSNWVSATTYPGQNPGTGTVTIKGETTILITANVTHPITNLLVDADYYFYYIDYEESHYEEYYVYGYLTFSAESAVSLTVSGNVTINGEMNVANQIGAKTHRLSIGASFLSYGFFYPFNEDDKLGVVFNTTEPNCRIEAYDAYYRDPYFQDITFDGIGITVNTPIRILGTATFINGVVVSLGNSYFYFGGSIFFEEGATVTGASNTSFVDGVVYKKGDDSFIFPIGDEGVYSPLAISAPVGQQEIFGAWYVGSGAPGDLSISDPGLYSVSSCEYWELRNVNGNITSYPLGVTVGWTSSSGCGSSPYIANVPEVTLAHSSWNTWDSHGGIGTGTTTNGSVTWSGVTNFGAFTLGNVDASCIPPSGLNTTNIGLHSAAVSWSDATGSVSYDVDYKATSSYYWINKARGITTTSVNLSGLNPSTIYEWKVRANCSSGSSAYMQTQFTTLPCGEPSGLSTTNISAGSATLSWIAMPSATSYRVEYKQSTASSWITAVYETTSLSYNLPGLSSFTEYDWRIQATCGAPPPGNYAQASFITLTCDNAYEPNNTSNDAKTIALGTTIYAGITSLTDVDWFKLTIPGISNAVLTIMLNNLPADYDLYVYNKNFVLVGSSTNSGTSNDVVSNNSHGRNATYYIKIVGKNGAYNISQCYNILAQAGGSGGSVTRVSDPANEVTDILDKQLLYPNPASEFVHLRFNSTTEGPVNTQIFNTAGQLVKQNAIKITKGYNEVKIAVYDIKQGMYLLRINNGELNIIRKFVIAR
jgi:hypothetical protein